MNYDLKALSSQLMETRSFLRIQRVSFLGILDRFNTSRSKARPAFSRGEHSNGVFTLGIYAARQIAMPIEEAAYLATACLVHDLGHPPFSHSLEYAFPKDRRLWDHHKVLEDILLTPKGPEQELARVLKRNGISSRRVLQIAEGEDPLSFFFHSPINLDTLDGISRSLLSFGFRASYDVKLLAGFIGALYAGATVEAEVFKRHADEFWKSKGLFYGFLENHSDVAQAERHFQSAVRRQIPQLTREYFRMTDDEFAIRHPQILAEAIARTDMDLPRATQHFEVNSAVRKIDKESVKDRYVRRRSPF